MSMTPPRVADTSAARLGFTLTELLIVITILCLLIALLTPTANMMLGTARAVVCKSNMRQIYLGISAYSEEWSETTPWNLSYDGGGSVNVNAWGENWGQTVAVYMKCRVGNYPFGNQQEPCATKSRLGIFRCPENRKQTWQMGTAGGEEYTSYTGNGWGDLSMPWYVPWASRFFSMKLNRMQHTSELMAFWDGCYYMSEAWSDDGLGTVPYRGIGARGVRYCHLGKANIMFADGHTEGSALIRGMGAGTSVPVSTPMRASSWTNGRAWWSID